MLLSKLQEFEALMPLNNEFMPDEYYRDIFHYTSPDGFRSILLGSPKSVTIWASRHDCLNDASEGTIAEQVFLETCADLKDQGEIDEELYQLFVTVRPAKTTLIDFREGDSMRLTRLECYRYICSFSKNPDSLAMWNYYSKGNKYEGFNIGFFLSGLTDSLDSFVGSIKAEYHIYPVVYKKEEQKALVRSLLLKLKELYSDDQKTSIRYIISTYLKDWGLIFKSEFFQHEEEVRIIVDLPKKCSPLPVKYRTASGYIVPYIELTLEKDSVSYCQFGPLQCEGCQKENQLSVLNEMLESNGYSTCTGYSKIPVRY